VGNRARMRYTGCMLRVTLHGSGFPPVTLGSGETLSFGRQPPLHTGDQAAQLRHHALRLPRCAPHVSRLVGELVVGAEVVRLRWRASTAAQLSSLFEAPGGARRVALTAGMTALLDEGENQLVILRGRDSGGQSYTDIGLSIQVDEVAHAGREPEPEVAGGQPSARDGATTGPAPTLEPGGREWYVALALAEPWLAGADDYPRPATNREIYERVLGWHGYAWNLARPQRVDDALRAIARLAFGPRDDPFEAPAGGRVQNVRFAIGRRAAEVGLVTSDDLARVEREARTRATGG
jgi:hypothetical protein